MMFFRVITTYIFYFFFSTYVFSKEMIFEDFSENSGESKWEFISDRKNWPLIEWQFTSVAKYCNTYKRLLRYASILYRNNKENKRD